MKYRRSFYDNRAAVTKGAAKIVLKTLLELCQPKSVVDVGCGDASFLAALQEMGVSDILGIEGPWVGDDQLQIAPQLVQRKDLNHQLQISRRYDLASSIEVAEHLMPARAESFVDDLIGLADVVLFSAAIPWQGGVNHINERWQSYWAGLFTARGYHVIDGVRAALWTERDVPVPWRQNMLIYAHADGLRRWPRLADALARHPAPLLDVVHPLAFWRARKPRGLGHVLLTETPRALRRSLGLRSGPTKADNKPL